MSSELYTWHGAALVTVLGIAVLIAFVRLARGPTLADRVVALELIGTLAAGTAAVATLEYGEPWPLDAALIIALVSFLGTAAFARYIVVEEGGRE